MRKYKFLLLISILIAIFSLGICFLIENVPPFWYKRGEFIQWFFLGFSIIGCGGVILFFFLLYSSNKKDLLDSVNVFIINVLIFFKDFRTMLQSQEDYSDAIERLKNITAKKKTILEEKRGFIMHNSYVRVINKFSKYIDEYAEVHKKYVPQILKSRMPFEKEQLTVEAQRIVDNISYRGYQTAKKYAKRRGSGYNFDDFKAAVGAEEYERREAEQRAAEAAQPHGMQDAVNPQKTAKQPKEKKVKEKRTKGGDNPPSGFGQQPTGTPPPGFGQQPPPTWAGQAGGATQQARTQYQPQRPEGAVPPQRPQGTPPPQSPPPFYPNGQATGFRPQRPQAAPPPSSPPPSNPPPNSPPKTVIKPPQGVKPPDKPPV